MNRPPPAAVAGLLAPFRAAFARVGDDVWRVLLCIAVALACGLCAVDFAQAPADDLVTGEVAPSTVRASHTFQYTDFARRETALGEARKSAAPVYVYRAELVGELQGRITAAFVAGRDALDEGATPEARARAIDAFREALGVHVPDDEIGVLADAGFPSPAEELSKVLLGRAMAGLVINDRAELPVDPVPLQVIDLGADGATESSVTDRSVIRTPAEAREQVTMGLLETKVGTAPWVEAATTVSRACVRPNVGFDPLETRQRAEKAAAAVTTDVVTVKRGTILFRQGDVLTGPDIEEYRHLMATATARGPWAEWIAASLFVGVFVSVLWQLGSSYLDGFSTRVRDAVAAGALLIAVALFARVVVASSEGIADIIGMDAQAESVWFVVPLGGAVMLLRLLLGTPWALLFTLAASAVCGLIMDLRALHVLFFIVSGAVASGSVDHTRERMAVLRAGVLTGLVNAAVALLCHFVELFIGNGEVGLEVTIRPLWSMSFAFAGGLLAAFLVLGAMPLFESMGFVTDYRLMELANLNHPLLRQLMLRAPGSYHHSVVVGSLAEAACEAIGANALQARVAAYFHDVGKALKPQYFVENQRGAANRHDTMEPNASARVIIAHVTEGEKMAREHNLPKPIIDNILMHHGTGMLQLFYDRAIREASDVDAVDESLFRYPGPKPDTREAGVIMIADKVEAATRTIREPSEENLRAMIHKIINSVISDGQFEKCPLTFQEIHTCAETFVKVLFGIHHQRVEYPATAAISRATTVIHDVPNEGSGDGRRKGSVITLEIAPPKVRRTEPVRTGTHGLSDIGESIEDVTDPDTDYESLQNLPKGS